MNRYQIIVRVKQGIVTQVEIPQPLMLIAAVRVEDYDVDGHPLDDLTEVEGEGLAYISTWIRASEQIRGDDVW